MRIKFLLVYFLFFIVSINLNFSPPAPPPIEPFLNGVFPESNPGVVGSWEAVDTYPSIDIASPLRIIKFPEANDFLILNKIGEVWRVDFESQSKNLILDIKDRVLGLGEAGSTGIVLHPDFGNLSFPERQYIILFYRYKPGDPTQWTELGYNRLSKFYWDEQSQEFDADGEEILIQQYDRMTWHNGGGMFFGEDSFLYVSIGDEGGDSHISKSTQQIDNGLFSGLLRIDVNNNPTISHPIRRQPKDNGPPTNPGWPESFSQGYSIPNDNPWISQDSLILEEFYAIGIRSPYSMHFDKEDDQIWILDVGSQTREEVNLVEKGDNLQWPYSEGTVSSEVHAKPEILIGNEKAPIFEYDRSIGNAIISGGVYRNDKFPSINNKYLFADWGQNKLMALNYQTDSIPFFETLIPDIKNLGLDLPDNPGITGVHILDDGQVLLTVSGIDFTAPGKILSLKQNTIIPDPPQYLSELGIFKNLETLELIDDIIPYSVNSPLWSDRAIKSRWVAIPKEVGTNNSSNQINFSSTSPWTFPEGTVFIKHFDLPLSEEPDGEITKLETRFFVIGKDNSNYGVTYKWNDNGTDAELLKIEASKDFEVTDIDQNSYTQTWTYPSRDQCMRCHNQAANFVLGFNTHQLNGLQYYKQLGFEMNQLEYLNQEGLLNQNLTDIESLDRSYSLYDETIDLETRIKSYLDSNCASCHRSGNISNVDLDLRFGLPVKFQNSINVPTQSTASNKNNLIIKPGDHLNSELWLRDSSNDENRMPPLARSLVDQNYVDSLAKWIGQLTDEDAFIDANYFYPNPSNGIYNLRLEESWLAPINLRIFTFSGHLVYETELLQNSNRLNLHHLSSGTYFLTAVSEDKNFNQKFIKI